MGFDSDVVIYTVFVPKSEAHIWRIAKWPGHQKASSSNIPTVVECMFVVKGISLTGPMSTTASTSFAQSLSATR